MGFVKQQSMLLESAQSDVGKIFTDHWNTEDSKLKTKVVFLIRNLSLSYLFWQFGNTCINIKL